MPGAGKWEIERRGRHKLTEIEILSIRRSNNCVAPTSGGSVELCSPNRDSNSGASEGSAQGSVLVGLSQNLGVFPRMDDFSLLKYMNSESFWSPLYPSPGAYPKENCSVNHIYRCMENASLVLRSVLSMLGTGPGGK